MCIVGCDSRAGSIILLMASVITKWVFAVLMEGAISSWKREFPEKHRDWQKQENESVMSRTTCFISWLKHLKYRKEFPLETQMVALEKNKNW